MKLGVSSSKQKKNPFAVIFATSLCKRLIAK